MWAGRGGGVAGKVAQRLLWLKPGDSTHGLSRHSFYSMFEMPHNNLKKSCVLVHDKLIGKTDTSFCCCCHYLGELLGPWLNCYARELNAGKPDKKKERKGKEPFHGPVLTPGKAGSPYHGPKSHLPLLPSSSMPTLISPSFLLTRLQPPLGPATLDTWSPLA